MLVYPPFLKGDAAQEFQLLPCLMTKVPVCHLPGTACLLLQAFHPKSGIKVIRSGKTWCSIFMAKKLMY